MGSGLVLGREGPTVHMGAAIGAEAARRARLPDSEVRMMQTALGGAGLAVAFNAPIGGAPLHPRRGDEVVPGENGSGGAAGCRRRGSRLILGNHADFDVEPIGAPALHGCLFVVFGLLTGCVGAGYNKLVLWFLDHVAGIRRIPNLAKAAIIGAIIGLAMSVYPLSVGGGEDLTQHILGGQNLVLAVVVGISRCGSSPVPCRTRLRCRADCSRHCLPGALWGLLFVGCFDAVWPGDATQLAIPMALVGMAAFFGATVRAPVTGMVVVTEMTATTATLVPMMAAPLPRCWSPGGRLAADL